MILFLVARNVRCGSIQCQGGEINFGNIQFTGTITGFTRSVQVENVFEECQAFSTSANSDIISPGLVKEGTKCGNGQVKTMYMCVV